MNRHSAHVQFAQWLGETHPEVYDAVFAAGIAHGANARMKTSLRGLGDDSTDSSDFSDPTLTDIGVDQSNLDYVEGTSLSDVADALPLFDTPLSASGGTSSGSAPAQAGIPAQTQSVASWLGSAQGAQAVTQLGTAVLNTVTSANIAQAQMAVVQAQAQRAQVGLPPQPISYVTGANGGTVPVYNTSLTSQPIPGVLTTAISNGTSVPVTLPNGATGYTLNSATLSSLFGSNTIWIVLLASAVGLALIAGN